jgi:hypothetical protein
MRQHRYRYTNSHNLQIYSNIVHFNCCSQCCGSGIIFSDPISLSFISDPELSGSGSDVIFPDPDPDPAKSFGTDRLWMGSTTLVCSLM